MQVTYIFLLSIFAPESRGSYAYLELLNTLVALDVEAEGAMR